MPITRRLMQTAGVVAGAIATIAAAAPDTPIGRTARRVSNRGIREVRYAVASAPGLLYRLAGRHPDPGVGDDVLVDRVRSELGPLEKRLDIPHVHVMSEDHIVLLHGEVPDEGTARTIEMATMHVSGVRGVESHLHAGLIRGDTRPSQGRVAPQPSDALRALLTSAEGAGAHDARAAVHAVLCAFSDRLPDGEREQVFTHLPEDVRALAGPARRHGERPVRLRTVPQFVVAVAGEGGIETKSAEAITRAVLAQLHRLVPEEDRDVAAVLPTELRELWHAEPAR